MKETSELRTAKALLRDDLPYVRTYARLRNPILKGLDVYPENMRKNLDITNGAIMCENVMMHLSRRWPLYGARKSLRYAVKAYEEKTSTSKTSSLRIKRSWPL
jgi:adenylosuccinate lyase